ncbi:HNH endonuclease [Mycolicibacterium houstonense]|uniref:HNH endonuclease n=1 Tax=Mycolicibacterium houstonense TaxID=146021 RepID=UPI000830D4E6|nr:HNH endonuclease [Mycolicibacterium houstonense]
MAWDTSDRRDRLPANWPEIRRGALRAAGHRCQIQLPGCTGVATEVDHVRFRDETSPLQAACARCHGQKSSKEGVAQRAKLRAMKKRPPPRHPGRRNA